MAELWELRFEAQGGRGCHDIVQATEQITYPTSLWLIPSCARLEQVLKHAWTLFEGLRVGEEVVVAFQGMSSRVLIQRLTSKIDPIESD